MSPPLPRAASFLLHSTAQHGSAEGWAPPCWVSLVSRWRGGAWTPDIDTRQDIAVPFPWRYPLGNTSPTPVGSQLPSGQGEQSSSRTCGFEMLTASGSHCVAPPRTKEGANPIPPVTVDTHPCVHREEHQAVRAQHPLSPSLGSWLSPGHQAVPRAPFPCLHFPGCQAALSHRAAQGHAQAIGCCPQVLSNPPPSVSALPLGTQPQPNLQPCG